MSAIYKDFCRSYDNVKHWKSHFHDEIFAIYRDVCPLYDTEVLEKSLSHRIQSILGKPKSGRLSIAYDASNVAKVKALVLSDA